MRKLIRSASVCGLASLVLVLQACQHPETAPDKTLAGTVLGAGWGAGSGAIVGNQIGHPGEGIAVGAGLGAVAGGMSGHGYDATEEQLGRVGDELASLKIQNLTNRRKIEQLQAGYDHAASTGALGGVYQVFFDDDSTSMRTGAIANLETIAASLKADPRAYRIHVVGHSDDAGVPEYNDRLAESRARTVSAYLVGRGISADQVVVESFGSKRPIASNATPVGRQLNRRVDVYVSN